MTPPLAQEYLEAWGRPELRLGISVVFGYDSNGETHSFIHSCTHPLIQCESCLCAETQEEPESSPVD